MSEEFTYSIDVDVGKELTETEKNQLMVAMEKALSDILGQPKSGTIFIYSKKKS